MTHVLCALLVTFAPTLEKTKFEWKPIVGYAGAYTTTNMHRADMGGGEVDLKIMWGSAISVKSLEGKKVALEVENDDPEVFINGQPDQGINVQVPSDVQEYGLDLKYSIEDSDHGPGLGLFGGFVLPDKAIEVGEEYSIGGMKAKYVGKEKVGNWDSHKFTFECLKGKSKDDLWSEGTVWLSVTDLFLVKRTAVFHNIDFGMGNEIVKNEIVRTK